MEYIKFLKDYILEIRKLALKEIANGNEKDAIALLKQIRVLKQDAYNKGVIL